VAVFTQEFNIQICEALGETLAPNDLSFCLRSMELLTPKAGQQLWTLSERSEGLYILLAGRVRLIDPEENLLLSLAPASTTGEFWLFPGLRLRPYTARASHGVQLGKLSYDALQQILSQYPQIRERLYDRALRFNLMLNFGQHPSLKALSRSYLWEVFQDAERETLAAEATTISASSQVWLIEHGSLVSQTNQVLTHGSLCSNTPTGTWRALEPTILYRLAESALEEPVNLHL
jgi:CRP-like cAMP-binding protein